MLLRPQLVPRTLISQTCGPQSCSRTSRHFTASARRLRPEQQQRQHRKESFSSRLRAALSQTRVQWYPIPVGVGIGFLAFLQFYKVQKREKALQDEYDEEHGHGQPPEGEGGRPKKRKRVRPEGPWQVQIMSTLPLKAISRIWGRFNELEIPYYLRVPGFRLYSWIFGVKLDEMAEQDLHAYPNLASFFYRTLKPGVRPLDPNPNALLSPADGKVIQFGIIENGEVEQVKGVTYSLDALLGQRRPSAVGPASVNSSSTDPDESHHEDAEVIRAEEEFARVNGISYTLPNLFSGSVEHHEMASGSKKGAAARAPPTDQSTTPRASSETAVREDFARSEDSTWSWWGLRAPSNEPKRSSLYYIVVYLAPGDYHRFHSPASWVVSARRHFAGELYSVSPYLQRTLPGLFTLNERVVLLGRWRHGFFSYTPVGATNVGSIIVNFDRELRTNSLTTDTAADRAAEQAAARGEAYSGFSEATYAGASAVLGGHALRRGEEMGGFQLGSTIVLVFEAPKGLRRSFDQGFADGQRSGGWKWCVEKGQKVQVGQAIGYVDVAD